MWGICPFGSSIVAILALLIPEKRRRAAEERYPVMRDGELGLGRMVS
jgi:hypothetical protein